MPDMIRLAIGAMLRLTDLLTVPGLHFLAPSAGPIAASPSVSIMPAPARNSWMGAITAGAQRHGVMFGPMHAAIVAG